MLENMYEQNYQYYLELEKYAVAGEMKADEIKTNQFHNLKHELQAGDQIASMQFDTLRNAIELLEQRVL